MVCQCLHASFVCFQLHHIIAAALVWLYSRRDIHRATFPFVVTLIGLSSYKTLIIEYDVTSPEVGCNDSSFVVLRCRILVKAVGLGSWTQLFSNAVFTTSQGLLVLQLYQGLAIESNSVY